VESSPNLESRSDGGQNRILLKRGLINCLLAALLFGAATPCAKLLLRGAGPLTLAGLLYLGAAVVAAPSAYWAGARAVTRRDLVRLLTVAIAGGLTAPALLMLALAHAPATSVSLWLNLEAVATALLGWAFFWENLDYLAWLGILTIAAAGGVLAGLSSSGGLVAAILIGLACLCWAIDNNLTCIIKDFTPSQMTMVKGVIGGAFNLTIGAMLEHQVFSPQPGALALTLGAVSYGASLVLYINGARLLGAVRAQAIFALAPFVGCVLSWMILGEPIEKAQLAAGLMMAGGISLMYARHEHMHSHPVQIHSHAHRHDDRHHAHVHTGPIGGHTHEHTHAAMSHAHWHLPDLHHRHAH
jgi:drug/metabolite transporter (DMT)-like permease